MTGEYTRFIMRNEFDEDIFHLGYSYKKGCSSRLFRRIACTIHIDDIEGMFGKELYEFAREIKPGSWDFMP